jgi:Lar family restriction alleviation protein|tara:strand:- start:35 stop:205 length:171 start_codon:yes stop_codon:yes gene_type:complete
MKQQEPDPCPFCGSKDVQAECLSSIDLYWFECWSCGASGGSGENFDEAIAKWNERS